MVVVRDHDLLAGYLPNPQVAVATTAILIQTTSLMYTVPMALSSSVSTRVGNELGACRPAIGVRINLGSFYFLGTPVAVVLAFWYKT